MRYDEIKEMFAESDTCVMIDAAKKQEMRNAIRAHMEAHLISKPVSRWQLMKMQVCYMDKRILIIHLMACLGTIILGIRCQYWGQVSVILSGALGALSLLEVGSLFCSGMTELGESCYLNVRQLAAFQMVSSGLLSLAALSGAAVSVSLKYQLHIMEISIHILVPFVFTEWVCLTVLLMETGRRNLLLLAAAGVFSTLFWSVLASVPEVYEASALLLWGVALFAGTGILAVQVRRFFRALDKGEILCADWN